MTFWQGGHTVHLKGRQGSLARERRQLNSGRLNKRQAQNFPHGWIAIRRQTRLWQTVQLSRIIPPRRKEQYHVQALGSVISARVEHFSLIDGTHHHLLTGM